MAEMYQCPLVCIVLARMRSAPTFAALVGLVLLAGCGGDAPDRDLRSDRLTILDWARASPRALCVTEDAARAETGRAAVRTQDGPAGKECWIALDATEPIASGEDVVGVSGDNDRDELRFDADARERLIALGTDAHVGVVYDGRLLDVVFPKGGVVRIPAAEAED
ncbi:hypothetical protein GKE82_18900 [Conexibacter sp. W3-3-2]|uniref:hypothetical protein n=1 Tax=Conexibacter sp. W3-3-2 TaxID=2675227 RepID=UPI0012B9B2CC|nr:hypothetical protein [Conexibacter sp. W3-3-2]MTD46297.1 hypothetical protein [Conexibacter sp. W3-3-2]